MARKPPPTTDAQFRLIHGPWPRWSFQLSLVGLLLRTAAVVGVCIVVALGAIAIWPKP